MPTTVEGLTADTEQSWQRQVSRRALKLRHSAENGSRLGMFPEAG